MEDGDKFIRTVRVAGLACGLLLALLVWTANKSLERIDKLASTVEEISRTLAVQQSILFGYEKRLDRLEYPSETHVKR